MSFIIKINGKLIGDFIKKEFSMDDELTFEVYECDGSKIKNKPFATVKRSKWEFVPYVDEKKSQVTWEVMEKIRCLIDALKTFFLFKKNNESVDKNDLNDVLIGMDNKALELSLSFIMTDYIRRVFGKDELISVPEWLLSENGFRNKLIALVANYYKKPKDDHQDSDLNFAWTIIKNGGIFYNNLIENPGFKALKQPSFDCSSFNLTGWIFNGFELDWHFNGSNLSHSSFQNVKLSQSKFIQANLTRSTFENVTCSEVDFSFANLQEAVLKGNFDGSNFFGATLTSADLSAVNLKEANFMGADLRCANLSNSILTGANLSFTNLECANLSGANLEGANLDNIDWKFISLEGIKIDGNKYGFEILRQKIALFSTSPEYPLYDRKQATKKLFKDIIPQITSQDALDKVKTLIDIDSSPSMYLRKHRHFWRLDEYGDTATWKAIRKLIAKQEDAIQGSIEAVPPIQRFIRYDSPILNSRSQNHQGQKLTPVYPDHKDQELTPVYQNHDSPAY